jgi:hypothetical protein
MNRPKIPPQPVQLPPQKPPTHQQPTIQDHLPFMKPNLISSEPQQQQQPTVVQSPPPAQEMRRPQPMQSAKKTVDLDLGKPIDSQSAKNHHSASKMCNMCKIARVYRSAS